MTDALEYGDSVVIVNVDRLAEEAYHMGHERFADAASDSTIPEQGPADVSVWKESARWANHVLPRLRCMAGYDDGTGMGTWTTPRPVVALRDHNTDDEPASGQIISSSHLHDLAVDWWDRGAYDALEGEPAECDTGEIVAV